MHTGHIIGMPVSFPLYGYQHHLSSVLSTGISGISSRRARFITGIRFDDLRRQTASVELSPFFHILRHTAISARRMVRVTIVIHHIICRAMRMDNRYRPHTRRLPVVHRNTTDRTEGRYLVPHPGHGVIRHHASHGKSRQVNPVTVDMATRVHGVDDDFQKTDIRHPADVPCFVKPFRINHHKLGRICHGIPSRLVTLVSCILLHAVQ